MTLFDIDNEIRSCWDDETGEVFDAEKLESLLIAREQKTENVALYIKELGYEADALANEIKNLQARKKTAENRQEALKNYLTVALAGEKFKSAKVAISYRKSEAVEITCPVESLPTDFWKVETKVSADKTAIKSYLKEGNEIDGVTLVTKNNIQIK